VENNEHFFSPLHTNYNKTKTMKLNILSLLTFFTIACITVVDGHGQLLRGGSDDTIQEQELDTENLHRTDPEESTPFFEQLLFPPQVSYVYENCEDYPLQFGNFEVTKTTDKIMGSVGVFYGCAGITIEKLNAGGTWQVVRGPHRHCFLLNEPWIWNWGGYGTYRVRVIEANNNLFNLRVCWD
jgi:hypothetical protein